jgi:hypothetical protein
MQSEVFDFSMPNSTIPIVRPNDGCIKLGRVRSEDEEQLTAECRSFLSSPLAALYEAYMSTY